MDVSGVSPGAQQDAYNRVSKDAAKVERAVVALKKQADAEKVQAEGMLNLIQHADDATKGFYVNVYA
jgi:uncharacterized protein (UPF0335 family)